MTVPVTTHDQLREALQTSSHHIVDVREPAEFAAGHVPGALNLPLSAFDLDELPSGKPVILMCQAGGRSLRALNHALLNGHALISHYPPGFGGWRAAGGAIEY